MMHRAYSLFEIKRADPEQRVIEGLATSPEPDRMGDVVEPDGAEFKLPVPLLLHHDSRQPIGHIVDAKVSANGIAIKAMMARIEEPGTLKDRLDEAWQSIKIGLIRGLSIGFRAIERSYMEETNGIRFLRWELLEISAVTIPANAEASITTVRSLVAPMAASGLPTTNPSGAPEQLKTIKPVILREPVRVHPVRVIIPGKEAR